MVLLGIPPFWGWLGVGFILIGIEALLAPGSYLLWIGLAALIMALASSLLTFSAGGEIALFGVLALLCGLAGWRLYGRARGKDAAEGLHEPLEALIGKELLLSSAIMGGSGQAQVGDSVWRVEGPDLPAGARVKVIGVNGTSLIVKAA